MKLGMRNATQNASVAPLAPKAALIDMSRARPSTRDTSVMALNDNNPRNMLGDFMRVCMTLRHWVRAAPSAGGRLRTASSASLSLIGTVARFRRRSVPANAARGPAAPPTGQAGCIPLDARGMVRR